MTENIRRLKIFSRSLFILYVFITIYFLFFSEALGRTIISENYRYNLTLFKEIERFLSNSDTLGVFPVVLNVVGNVLCFMPFGFLVPMIHSRKIGLVSMILRAFGFSMCIEVAQLFLKVGCFDVDDLLMNTLGGILGYLLFKIYGRQNSGRRISNEK